MKKIILMFLMSILLIAQKKDEQYIRDHAKIAVEEMHLYKVPASITLSQGILESSYGESKLATQAFNHFGIKCKPEWKGKTISHDDNTAGECFRKYNSVVESYRDHSKFLAERSPYVNLFKLDITDYKGWSHGLRKAGYATNPKYPQLLIGIIEKYNLHEFDKLSSVDEIETKLVELFTKDQNQLTYNKIK